MEIFIDFFVWPILVSQMFHMPVLVAAGPVGFTVLVPAGPGRVIGAPPMPTVIGEAAGGKQSEAKQNISSVNRAQTAYRAEKSSFANTFDELALGILSGSSSAETPNYSYQIVTANADLTIATVTAKDATLKSYAGAVVRYQNSANQSVMTSVICETTQPSQIPPAIPQVVGNAPVCPPDSVTIEP
ncbi:MAG: type IV pilin-like G/H family protein [Cyanosarcina radialis HA8281-LM2]|jgi:type IV pilus assembly protein PilA|nr:type IV pilin-like G/H family protein [Cyanosarcina radialis HA8281-LM2]